MWTHLNIWQRDKDFYACLKEKVENKCVTMAVYNTKMALNWNDEDVL